MRPGRPCFVHLAAESGKETEISGFPKRSPSMHHVGQRLVEETHAPGGCCGDGAEGRYLTLRFATSILPDVSHSFVPCI
jgi:hypothetical protein